MKRVSYQDHPQIRPEQVHCRVKSNKSVLLVQISNLIVSMMFRFFALIVAMATSSEAFRMMPRSAPFTSTSLTMMAGADDYPPPRPEFNEFDAFKADNSVLAKVCMYLLRVHRLLSSPGCISCRT